MTAGRTYLSIGDVLTLLRQEFPDVTISKIRFLESQGLVNPERTPSGYRKFYEHDVERLRWVLRQQREHFLPLKVIKGRLEDETSEEPETNLGNGHGTADPVQKASTAVGGTAKDSEGAARNPSRISAVGVEDRVPSSDTVPEVPGHLPGFDPPAGDESTERLLAGESAGPLVSHAVYSPAQGGSPRTSQHSRSSQSGASRPLGTIATDNAARQAGGVPDVSPPSAPSSRPGAHESSARTAARAEAAGQASRPGMLTVSELAAAAGSSESAIEDLESYGILTGRSVGGVVHFDDSEITIARLAGEFAKFGIEPRHLRLYKHSSEREAGFVEQLVLPLLKQRNPEARKRAEEMVSDLTRLGEGLKAAMVRRSLQDLLGG